MDLSNKKYRIKGWKEEYFLTAKELYELIMCESSKSNYDWIASAHELVKVITKTDFPENYAIEIKLAILNCFAELELRKEYPSSGTSNYNESVNYCYNSLFGNDIKIATAKHKYLRAIIKSVTKYHFSFLIFDHLGQTYDTLCSKWENEKFKQYCFTEKIDFNKLRKKLHEDFDKTMKTAEAEGRFKEDDEKHLKEERKFWSSINLEDI